MASLFSPTQTDEEVVATVVAHYFTPEELAQARELERTESYERAIAYLAHVGADSLRDSGEEHPPRVYITIPGGRILIHHPARPFPEPTIKVLSATHLALYALPPAEPTVHAGEPQAREAQAVFWTDEQKTAPQPSIPTREKRDKKRPTAPRTCVFVEQSIRIGTKRQFWTRQGWVVKKGFLGYVLTKLPSEAYRVELVHLVSNWVMTSTYLDVLDETTHARLQGWVSDAHRLTDWSRGINAILREQPGKEKKWTWSQKLKELWLARRQEPRQLSFF